MRSIFLSALVLAVIGISLPSHAQNAPNKEAIKPLAGRAQAVLDQWNDIGRKLTAMAEDFPEDKYDFRATPAERTFAENLLHVAGSNYYFTNPVTGSNAKVDENPKRETYKTKADVVAYVKKSFADGAAAIKAKGDKGMSDTVVDPFAHQQTRISDYAYGFIEHSGEHYGQLVVYYRLSGLVPPESRPQK